MLSPARLLLQAIVQHDTVLSGVQGHVKWRVKRHQNDFLNTKGKEEIILYNIVFINIVY
jgi:hypothetical protein